MSNRYLLISRQTPPLLESEIDTALKAGWSLQGGIAITVSNNQLTYAQALYKPAVAITNTAAPVVYAPGTTVKLIKAGQSYPNGVSPIGRVGIISSVILHKGSLRYTFAFRVDDTSEVLFWKAWFTHDDFEFISPPTSDTLALACQASRMTS